jgi:hypothetical protein
VAKNTTDLFTVVAMIYVRLGCRRKWFSAGKAQAALIGDHLAFIFQ